MIGTIVLIIVIGFISFLASLAFGLLTGFAIQQGVIFWSVFGLLSAYCLFDWLRDRIIENPWGKARVGEDAYSLGARFMKGGKG